MNVWSGTSSDTPCCSGRRRRRKRRRRKRRRRKRRRRGHPCSPHTSRLGDAFGMNLISLKKTIASIEANLPGIKGIIGPAVMNTHPKSADARPLGLRANGHGVGDGLGHGLGGPFRSYPLRRVAMVPVGATNKHNLRHN